MASIYAQMITYDELTEELSNFCLSPLGGFHPIAEDRAPEECQTLILIGPKGPEFWAIFQKSLEYNDCEPDPLDRWSMRVFDGLATQLDATALLPFGGSPYLPFYSWALKTGRIYVSPIKFLVHDQSGLFLSFRGALAFKEHISLPAPSGHSPCIDCPSPCMTACPVNAFDVESYNITACKSHVRSTDHKHCRAQGCAARRSCPISQSFGRVPAQSEFHMKAFL